MKEQNTSIHQMMEKYWQKVHEEDTDILDREPYRLEPILHVNGPYDVTLEFRLGTDKTYVIHSLEELYLSYRNHREYQLYDTIGLMIKDHYFDDHSLRLWRFFLRHVQTKYRSFSLSGVSKTRYMALAPAEVEELVQMYRGECLTVVCQGKSAELVVTDCNPSLHFIGTTLEDGGMELRPDVMPGIYIPGQTRGCMVEPTGLCIVSESFAADCGYFLEALSHGIANNHPSIRLYSNDITAFYRNVMPFLKQHMDFDDEAVRARGLRPVEMKAEFRLDRPDSDTLTCQVLYSYENLHFNPYWENPVSDTRDEWSERKIDHFLRRYFLYRDENGLLVIKNHDELVFEFLAKGITELQTMGDIYVSEELNKVHIRKGPGIHVGVSVSQGLLDFDIDMDGLSSEELFGLLQEYRLKKKYYRLKNGDFIDLTDPEGNLAIDSAQEMVRSLRLKQKDLQETIHLPLSRALYLDDLFADKKHIRYQTDDTFRQLLYRMTPKGGNHDKVPEAFQGELRPYQEEGYHWLLTLAEHRFGGVLADEMGLGKTIQIIALLLHEAAGENYHTSLICCPATLVYNWYYEFQRFAPSLRVAQVIGEPIEREHLIHDYDNYDVLITSYDTLRRDAVLYQGCHFMYHIIDEAQFIKNQNTLKAQAVKEIWSEIRFALTGTPMENRLSELWSIYDFLMPGYLFSYQIFKADIEIPVVKEDDRDSLERLHRLIAPFVLRRLKKDVLTDLPEKNEETVYAVMTGEQKKLYTAQALQMRQGLQNQDEQSYHRGKIQILTELMRLRQICCDPHLVYDNYHHESVKMETCMQLLTEAVHGGHRVLLFSQFTTMLALLEERLRKEQISTFVLTGETPVDKRQGLVERFQNGEADVFLISLRAGGTGLNLTGADVVIHYDPWWNVAAQNQATDRSHRIGQKHPVTVYKLIVKETIEDRILELQTSKQQLAEAILAGDSLSLGNMTKEELLALLE